MRRLADQHLGKVASIKSIKPFKVASKNVNRGGRWTRLAKKYRSIHPICEICSRRAAVHVHHKTPISQAPEKLYQWSNLQSCCLSCHEGLHNEPPPPKKPSGVSEGTAGGRLDFSPKSSLPISKRGVGVGLFQKK